MLLLGVGVAVVTVMFDGENFYDDLEKKCWLPKGPITQTNAYCLG